jgi:dipicolinate synthase subunit A
VIFNTVPNRIFVGDALDSIPRNCLFVDLASAPGGIDFATAEQRGLRAIWATALPGKYSPETAGVMIAETVETILSD